MANHKSALKRIRQSSARRLRNRYRVSTVRTAIKKLRLEKDKQAALAALPNVLSLIDRLSKKRVIHKNKAANQKSKLTRLVNSL